MDCSHDAVMGQAAARSVSAAWSMVVEHAIRDSLDMPLDMPAIEL